MEQKLIILDQGPHHIAVFKPHNMATVGGRGVKRPTLLDLARERFGQNIFAVHRLDRATSGIVIFARSVFAKHAIQNAFKKRLVKKIYYAIVEGCPDFNKKIVEEPLKKIDLDNKKGPVAKQVVDKDGEKATTIIRLKKSISPDYALVEAQPISGRMHQIRAHLAFLGYPILGDTLYGAKSWSQKNVIALCAVKLSMPLPKKAMLSIDITKDFSLQNYLSPDQLS